MLNYLKRKAIMSLQSERSKILVSDICIIKKRLDIFCQFIDDISDDMGIYNIVYNVN